MANVCERFCRPSKKGRPKSDTKVRKGANAGANKRGIRNLQAGNQTENASEICLSRRLAAGGLASSGRLTSPTRTSRWRSA